MEEQRIDIYWKHKNKSKYTLCSEPIYLDIETANNGTICWMVTAQVKFAGHYHLFRKPTDLMNYFLDLINQHDLNDSRKIIVLIHNASYDLSYLLPWIQMMLPGYDTRQGLYDGRNRIIMYQQGAFEFRCTYLLSACSLEKWCEEMNAEHKKKVGLYNYDKILYQDSELSADEEAYDMYDILAMEDCLRAQLEAYGDDLASIPITSTAYSRRMLRTSALSDPHYRKDIFLHSVIDAAAYNVIHPSYAGGYTHTNRYIKGKTIRPNKKKGWKIVHDDFRSHYPTQIVDRLMPWGRCDLFYTYKDNLAYRTMKGHDINIQDLLDLYPEYTTVSVIRFRNMHLKDRRTTMPFMQISKIFNTQQLNKEVHFRAINDNGRLLAAFGTFDTQIDNRTLEIIREQYEFEYQILKVYRFENQKCPQCIADVINELFKKKSDYKIEWQKAKKEYGENSEEAIEALFRLNQSKKLLNSLYGCLAMDPIRYDDDIDYVSYYEGKIDDPFVHTKVMTDGMKQEKLDKFYSSRNNFLPYIVGILTTSEARYQLYRFLQAIGEEYVLYCDTDSAFYLANEEIEKRVADLNAEYHKDAAYIINSEGKKIYYDVFEAEEDVEAFRSLHSKCYAMVVHNDKKNIDELIATIAGVPRRTIIAMNGEEPIYLTREEELAGINKKKKLAGRDKYDPFKAINNLKIGTTFKVNTGFSARYVQMEPHTEVIDGHEIETSGGCIIRRLSEKKITDNNMIDYNIEFNDMYMEGE